MTIHKKMQAQKNLQAIPGVGKSLSKDLADLGYQAVEELKNENPETMYQNLCHLRDRHIDRCVLYVFRCAVYYVSQAEHNPELLKWCNPKDTSQDLPNIE